MTGGRPKQADCKDRNRLGRMVFDESKFYYLQSRVNRNFETFSIVESSSFLANMLLELNLSVP